MLIATTTLPTRLAADQLAAAAIAQNLAVCAQVEGPLHSHYVWEGRPAVSEEWRVTFKLLAETATALSAYVHGAHPYATPQWLVVKVEQTGEKYLSWAQQTRSSVNF
jgi:periplasmic divalent cation tolerance protein